MFACPYLECIFSDYYDASKSDPTSFSTEDPARMYFEEFFF